MCGSVVMGVMDGGKWIQRQHSTPAITDNIYIGGVESSQQALSLPSIKMLSIKRSTEMDFNPTDIHLPTCHKPEVQNYGWPTEPFGFTLFLRCVPITVHDLHEFCQQSLDILFLI